MSRETAILAGGCFWGMEELFRHLPGVIDTRVGYCGGTLANPTYDDICTGKTGHAEALEVVFDPAVLPYAGLLAFFFQIHDPTTSNRQGNDVGSQYRSMINTLAPAQKDTATVVIAAVESSGKWPGRIVTQIEENRPFYEAEKNHQDYLQRFPHGYTCHFIRRDWAL